MMNASCFWFECLRQKPYLKAVTVPSPTAPAPVRPLLVELASIVDPLEVGGLFPQTQPLEVELGCGDASFLLEYARRNPQTNFIGVERLLGHGGAHLFPRSLAQKKSTAKTGSSTKPFPPWPATPWSPAAQFICARMTLIISNR